MNARSGIEPLVHGRKWRNRCDMSENIVYGFNAVSEALHNPRTINRIYIAKESRDRSVAPLLDLARLAKVRFDFVPQAKLNELTGTHAHQGIAALISPASYLSLKDLIETCSSRAIILVADRIQHERNLGLMIRSALGAGAAGIVISDRASALLDEAVVRASAGTALRLPICKEPNLPTAIRLLKEHGFWIYGLDAQADQSVFDVDWARRVALVVGNETEGLRPGVRKTCDVMVKIPLRNELESLNAAVSASIALFQAAAHHEK